MNTGFLFERTELRVMQNTYPNNEEFLSVVANLIGNQALKITELSERASIAEEKLRRLGIDE